MGRWGLPKLVARMQCTERQGSRQRGCAAEPWGKGTQMTDPRGWAGPFPYGSPGLAWGQVPPPYTAATSRPQHICLTRSWECPRHRNIFLPPSLNLKMDKALSVIYFGCLGKTL